MDTHRKTPNVPQMSQVRRPFMCLVTVTTFCWQWGHVMRPGTSVSCGATVTTTGTEKQPVTSTDSSNNNQLLQLHSGERLTRLSELRLLCGVHVHRLSCCCWVWGGDT